MMPKEQKRQTTGGIPRPFITTSVEMLAPAEP
jgi:hypothetical protein